MSIYLKRFGTTLQYEQYISGDEAILPNVSFCDDIMGVHYNPYVAPHDYSQDYLTFVAKENGTFTFTPQNSNVISYSTDGGSTWHEGNNVQVNSGDKVMWKGIMTPFSEGIGSFSASTNNFDVQGNPMSLLYGNDFKNQTDLSGKDYAFYSLFKDTKVVNAENLSLPATTLAHDCYGDMFSRCTNLTSAPELPATTLASYCYANMFASCTNLVTAPELPATTLANGCYNGMFNYCTSLTTAPELPATTLTNDCYRYMFQGCTNLSSITCLATDISARDCTRYWVSRVAASGTFIKPDTMADWTTGVNGIPSGWTVQDYGDIASGDGI